MQFVRNSAKVGEGMLNSGSAHLCRSHAALRPAIPEPITAMRFPDGDSMEKGVCCWEGNEGSSRCTKCFDFFMIALMLLVHPILTI